MTPQIPDKIYFKIGEVAKIAEVPPYVLRYWETEFKEIDPAKSRSKQRLYRRKDVETVCRIKGLLYEEGFTIEGARKQLRGSTGKLKKEEKTPQMNLSFSKDHRKVLARIKEELRVVEQLLK